MDFTEKSRAASFFSTLIMGPLGLVYASPLAGLLLMIFTVYACSTRLIASPDIVLLLCWMLAIGLGDHIVHKHNLSIEMLKKLLAKN